MLPSPIPTPTAEELSNPPVLTLSRPPVTHLGLGLIGPGLVGAELQRQLAAAAPSLASKGLTLSLLGIARSRCHHLCPLDPATPPLPLDSTPPAPTSPTSPPTDLAAFGTAVAAAATAREATPVLIDCTAGTAAPDLYVSWLSQGISVVTANKRFLTGPPQELKAALDIIESWNKLSRQGNTKTSTSTSTHGRGHGRPRLYYEASCGAGLPIISTLQRLVATGDRIRRIEGVLSGTLSYIFNTFTPATPFSSVVKGAKEAGYTEPDPREDLSGTDVARKVVILSRTVGLLDTKLEDIAVQSLVPKSLVDVDVETFMERLPGSDVVMAARAQEAKENKEVLRYVGVVDTDTGGSEVVIRKYGPGHPFAGLVGSDNMVSIVTDRYPVETPLVVRGPGAGAAVTAGGVFSDLLALAATQGAPY